MQLTCINFAHQLDKCALQSLKHFFCVLAVLVSVLYNSSCEAKSISPQRRKWLLWNSTPYRWIPVQSTFCQKKTCSHKTYFLGGRGRVTCLSLCSLHAGVPATRNERRSSEPRSPRGLLRFAACFALLEHLHAC